MSEKYYTRLDEISLFNWQRCIEGKHHFMLKNAPSGERTESQKQEDYTSFCRIYNTYLERYGLGNQMVKYLEAQGRVIQCRLNYAESGNKSWITDESIHYREMQRLDPNKHKGMTIGQLMVHLNKWMGGQWIRTRDISVEEFHNLIEEYEQSNK